MNTRATLTKSLHTVSIVARVADISTPATSEAVVRAALAFLGLPDDYAANDPTFAACVARVNKLRGLK